MNSIDYCTEQNVVMTNRSRLELTGIEDVESFSDTSVIALSSLGNISIDGEDLKIELFSADTGRLVVCGKFNGFCYFGRENKKRGIFRKNGG